MKKRPNHCAYIDKGLKLDFLTNEKDELLTSIRPCCITQPDKISKDHTRHIPIIDIKDVLTHPTRTHFQHWFNSRSTLHPSCISCTKLEKAETISPRSKINVIETDNTEFDFLRLDINLSNACNLACVFCNSKSSSLIETLTSKYKKNELPEHWNSKFFGQIKKVYRQPKNEDIGNLCADILKTYKIKSFKIIGGEPLLAENWKPIEKVLDDIDTSNLEFQITTNGTIMNDEIIRRLSKTKRSVVNISCDGIDKNYEFLRWPHKWNKMDKNLDFIFAHKSKVIKPVIVLLVNIFNFEFLPKIEEYYKNKGWQWYIHFNIKPDNSPLNYINLPNKLIFEVRQKIKDPSIKQIIKNFNTTNKRSLDSIIKDTKFYLAQRNMQAIDVFGPKTLEFLNMA